MNRLRKWLIKTRPGAINRRARFVLKRLGEHYWDASETHPDKLLPPFPPRTGKRFEAERLTIVTNFGCLTITWDGSLVYEHDGFRVRRFNYGAEWLDELSAVHDDLQSKARRGDVARWRDLD